MAEPEPVRQSQRDVEIEQEAGRFLVIGWQILFFDLVLWIFVPDEFRVGQYAVTLAAIIGFVVGATLVLIGIAQRKKMRARPRNEAPGHLLPH